MLQSLRSASNYFLRFNPLFQRLLRQVQDQKQWETARLRAEQNRRFLTVFRRAVRRSAFYQRHYAERGVNLDGIRSLNDLTQLPIVTRQDVRQHVDSIYIGWPGLRTIGRTSGSSGTPLAVYRDYPATVREGAYLWAQRALFGLHPGTPIISLRGHLDRTRTHYYDRWAHCLHLSSFHLREEQAEWYYYRIKEFAPYAILAYPSSVEILANLFAKRGRKLSIPYVFTSSEQVHEHQRAKVEQVFGTQIVDWYGNAERTIALEQRPDGHYYELPLYSVNEYEPNRTLTTGLISSTFPLIRYQVNDVIVPEVKHPFRVRTIVGRYDDLLHLPDGTQVGRIGAAFLDIDGLELAQFHQNTEGQITLRLVVGQRFAQQSLAQLQNNLRRLTDGQMNYQIKYVRPEDIVRTSAGKFKLVISQFTSCSSTSLTS